MNRVKFLLGKFAVVLTVVGFFVLATAEARGEDWVFYGGSSGVQEKGPILRDWYLLNKLKLVPKAEATTYHYYDRDSVAPSSPFPGGIVRVWEKAVLQRQTKSYEETKEDIEREEEMRLKRKINVLDYTWLFPVAVNRAAKEVATLYEINCDSRELFILEVNHYDKEGKRMTREANMDKDLWYPIRPETMMELLSKEACQ